MPAGIDDFYKIINKKPDLQYSYDKVQKKINKNLCHHSTLKFFSFFPTLLLSLNHNKNKNNYAQKQDGDDDNVDNNNTCSYHYVCFIFLYISFAESQRDLLQVCMLDDIISQS